MQVDIWQKAMQERNEKMDSQVAEMRAQKLQLYNCEFEFTRNRKTLIFLNIILENGFDVCVCSVSVVCFVYERAH